MLWEDKCLVMEMGEVVVVVVGGGRASSQVPDGGEHCGVSLRCPPILNLTAKPTEGIR